MKTLLRTLILTALLALPAFAQDGSIFPVVLKDDNGTLTVQPTGAYTLVLSDGRTFSGFGVLRLRGCSIFLDEITETSRLLVRGDSCNHTGIMSFSQLGESSISITDKFPREDEEIPPDEIPLPVEKGLNFDSCIVEGRNSLKFNSQSGEFLFTGALVIGGKGTITRAGCAIFLSDERVSASIDCDGIGQATVFSQKGVVRIGGKGCQ